MGLFRRKITSDQIIKKMAMLGGLVSNSVGVSSSKSKRLIEVEIAIFLYTIIDRHLVGTNKHKELRIQWYKEIDNLWINVITENIPSYSNERINELFDQRIMNYFKISKEYESFLGAEHLKALIEYQTQLIGRIIETGELSTYYPTPKNPSEHCAIIMDLMLVFSVKNVLISLYEEPFSKFLKDVIKY